MNNGDALRIHCSLASLPGPPDDLERQLARARQAGFVGVEGWPPERAGSARFRAELDAAGLAFGVAAYLPEGADAEPLFERAAAVGALYLEAQVDGYWRDDTWIDDRTGGLVALGERYGLPFFLETHRGRYTQDPRRTLALLERLPGLRLCGDFSHYASTCELKAPWPLEWREPLYRIAQRCGMLHARMNAGQRVQDPLPAVPPAQRDEFLRLWAHAVRHGGEAGGFVVTIELLPPDYQTQDGEGQPVGDLWAEALELKRLVEGQEAAGQDRASGRAAGG